MKIRRQEGFTLIELMITLAIAGIVMAGVFSTFLSQQDSYLIQEEVVVMQQNIRAAMSLMGRELRMASYSPITHSGGISKAEANRVGFTYEIDNNGTLQTIEYDLYDTYGDGFMGIGRKVGGAPKVPLAENIDNLEFVYLDKNGVKFAQPIASGDLKKITTIQLSMLARSDRADQKKAASAKTFTTLAGTQWNKNDTFRYRLLSTTIQLRN